MAPTSSVLVRPRRSLLRQAVVAIVIAMVPVFGVLYWFGIDHGTWPIVLIVHLVIALLCVATLVRQLTVFSAVNDTHLEGRGIFSPMQKVPLQQIASVTIVPVYMGQTPEPVEQLLVRDAAGHRLFRMRGNFWNPGDLAAVAAALPVATTVIPDAMSSREFFQQYPGSAYWFENRPIISVLVFIGFAALVIAVATLVLVIFRMRVAFLP